MGSYKNQMVIVILRGCTELNSSMGNGVYTRSGEGENGHSKVPLLLYNNVCIYESLIPLPFHSLFSGDLICFGQNPSLT